MQLIGIRETALRISPTSMLSTFMYATHLNNQPLVFKLKQTGISKSYIFTSAFYHLNFFMLYYLITQRGKKEKISGQRSVG